MKFADLTFKPHPDGVGIQATVDFPNGYGASIIQAPCSYGGEDGLYELAVVHNGSICYNTLITDDVLGHLAEEDIEGILAEIETLEEHDDAQR